MLVTLASHQKSSPLSIIQLKKVIHDRMAELVPGLTSGLSFYSENARYAEDSLEILEISDLGNSKYSMSYRFQWSIFNACLNINADEFITGKVPFSVCKEGLVFDIIDNTQPSTADEL
jgi:hypothetical protein